MNSHYPSIVLCVLLNLTLLCHGLNTESNRRFNSARIGNNVGTGIGFPESGEQNPDNRNTLVSILNTFSILTQFCMYFGIISHPFIRERDYFWEETFQNQFSSIFQKNSKRLKHHLNESMLEKILLLYFAVSFESKRQWIEGIACKSSLYCSR